MLSSEWIDIALGVVVVWFLLALAVSAVNEAVIRLLAMRSKQLWLALNQLLDTPEHQRDPKWPTLRTAFATAFSLWKYQGRPEDPTDTTTQTSRLYGTSAIQALENTAKPDRKTRIHNIPSSVFVTALLELGLRNTTGRILLGRYLASLPDGDAHWEPVKKLWEELDGTVGMAEVADAIEALPEDDQDRVRHKARLRALAAAAKETTSGREALRAYIEQLPADTAGREELQQKWATAVDDEGRRALTEHIAKLPADLAYREELIALNAASVDTAGNTIRRYIDGLPDAAPLKRQLATIWAQASENITSFRHDVEGWFDGQMARVSAMYRAQIRWITVIVAILVVLATWTYGLRVDSLTLVSDLQRDQNLRQAYAALASDISAADQAQLEKDGCGTEDDASKDEVLCLARGIGKADGLDIAVTKRIGPGERPWDAVDDTGDFFAVVAGLVITIVALSFGASFWWNVLRRLTGLRQGGKSAPSQ